MLCDRFTDATFAYQGGGRGLDARGAAQLEAWVQAGLQPDLTLWFDVDPRVAAARRAAGARAPTASRREDLAFFERVRAGYRARMQAAPAALRAHRRRAERDAVRRRSTTRWHARGGAW